MDECNRWVHGSICVAAEYVNQHKSNDSKSNHILKSLIKLVLCHILLHFSVRRTEKTSSNEFVSLVPLHLYLLVNLDEIFVPLEL